MKNTGATALKNISTTDADITACSKTASAVATYMAVAGNVKTDITVTNGSTQAAATAATANLKNNILEPGESFSYDCKDEAIKKTFPAGNKIVVNAVTNDTFATPMTDDDVATLEYNVTPSIILEITHDKKTGDATQDASFDPDLTQTEDDTQSVNDSKAYFTVKVTNPENSTALNSISISDSLVPTCVKNSSNITTLLTTAGNVKTTIANPSATVITALKNNVLDPGEYFSYDCSITNLSKPFPNDQNTISINALTADNFKIPVNAVALTKAVYDTTKFNITLELFNGNAFNSTTGAVIPGVEQDKQIIINGKAKFFVRISNNGEMAFKNISTIDAAGPVCNRTITQINTLLSNIDKTTLLGKNTQLDPGESIWYTCETQ